MMRVDEEGKNKTKNYTFFKLINFSTYNLFLNRNIFYNDLNPNTSSLLVVTFNMVSVTISLSDGFHLRTGALQ